MQFERERVRDINISRHNNLAERFFWTSTQHSRHCLGGCPGLAWTFCSVKWISFHPSQFILEDHSAICY